MRWLLIVGLGLPACTARWQEANDGTSGELPPTVSLSQPALGTTWETTTGVSLSATVSDDATPVQQLVVEVRSDVDGMVTTPVVGADGTINAVLTLSLGTHDLLVVVTDDDGQQSSAATTVRVVDPNAPSQPAVRVDPTAPVTGDDLIATVALESVDPEGDPLTYEWSWTVDGVDAGIAAPEVSGLLVSEGQTWTVTAWATDGDTRSPATTRSVLVGNAPPRPSSVTIQPEVPAVGATLTCAHTPVEDPEGDPFTFSYAWFVDGVDSGVTTETLATVGLPRGAEVACAVVADDGERHEWRSDTVSLGNTTPTVAGVILTPSAPASGDTLTCTATGVVDADADPVSLGYAWFVDDVASGTGATFSGGFVRDDVVRCEVTPSDAFTTGVAVRSDDVLVSNTAPSAPSIAFAQESVVPGAIASCLVAVPSIDPDGDTLAYAWSWAVDAVPVAGTASTYDTNGIDAGSTLTCTATPDDGFATGVAGSASVVLEAPTSGDVGLSTAWLVIAGSVGSGGFGKAVDRVDDLDGDGLDELIVSAPRGDASTKGSAWLFSGATLSSPGTLTEADADWSWYGSRSNDLLGAARGAAGVGDIDGDGLGDLVLTSPYEDSGGTDAGMAYVYYGGSTSWGATADALSTSDARFYGAAGDWLGVRVAGGDLDGDGLDDIAVSAPYNDLAASKAGAVLVFSGDAGRRGGAYAQADADAIVTGSAADTELGWSLDILPDVDGDGFQDLGVGIFYDDTNGTDAGSAAVISGDDLGGQSTYTADAFLVVRGTDATGRMGYDVSGIGDVDDDGLEDVAFGAYLSNAAGTDAGEVRVVYGVGGLNKEIDADEADASFFGDDAGAQFGSTIFGVGDFDGDGLADWLSGAPRSAEGGASNAGAAHLYSGRDVDDWGASGAAASVRVLGDTAEDWFGDEGVGGLDVNADGYSDFAIGAQNADLGSSGGGAVWIWVGP